MITGDFESRSVVDLKKLGATRYALDPLTQALCFTWIYDDEPDDQVHLWHRDHPWIGGEKSARPDELLERIASGELFEAHNARFEWLIWNYVLRREFPEFDVPLKLEQLRCSAAKASCVSLPRGLGEAVASVALEHRKDPDGQRLINKLCKPLRKRKTARNTTDLAFKTAARFCLFDTRNPGDIVTQQEAESIAEPLLHNYALKDWRANVRDQMHILAGEVSGKPGGWLRRIDTGTYQWTDKEPPPIPPVEDREIAAYKEAENEAPGVLWCEEEIEHRRNWNYCASDTLAERGLSEFCPDMTERELDYWFMDFRMNDRGVQLDLNAAQEAVKLCGQEVERLNAEMKALTDGMVPGGSKRIPFRKWANITLEQLQAQGHLEDTEPLPDTKADTLSFRLYGVPTKAGEDAKTAHKDRMEALWASRGPLGAKLHRSMEICLEVNRSSVAKYRQMVDSHVGGRLHDIMLYNGADRTGRWSGKGVQPHNFVRGYQEDMGLATYVDKKQPELGMRESVWDDILYGWPGAEVRKPDLDYVTIVWGDPLPVLAKACRGALVASKGKELYAADFNAIEARKLAWMSGCAPMLTLFATGGDPYCDMATAIYKRIITKADKTERQMGKKAVLGLGYAMGWEKFQATVWAEEGIWLDDEFCQLVVKIYRKEKCIEVPVFWKSTERAAIAAVEEGGEHSAGGGDFGEGAISYFVDGPFLHCRLPSGRLLAYLYPEVHTKLTYRFNALNEKDKPCIVSFPAKVGVAMTRVKYHAEKMAEKQRKRLTGDPPESFLSPHLSFMGRHTYTRQWQRCGTHGGSLVENADQASSRDLLAEAMFRVDQDPRFDLLLSIHDEVIAEAPIGTCTVKEFEEIMSEVPKWAPGMPIAAEGWKGPRLRK